MRFRIALLTVFTVSSLLLSAQTAARQPAPLSDHQDPKATADRVRQEFLHAWNAYKKNAWGHDELKPLSHTPRDWHSASLLMTPVDALDTMYVMGLKGEADTTREYIATHLSFD